jgi:hypothetical protein
MSFSLSPATAQRPPGRSSVAVKAATFRGGDKCRIIAASSPAQLINSSWP